VIPASVEKLCWHSFAECNSLSTVTFEPGSKLSHVEADVFKQRQAVVSICIPGALQHILCQYRRYLKISGPGSEMVGADEQDVADPGPIARENHKPKE
jgi:hypothetical protein